MDYRVVTNAMLLLPLASLLGACGAASGTADSGSQTAERAKIECLDGTTVAWNKTCPTSSPPPTTTTAPIPVASTATVAYDTSIGTAVDADGFASLPLRAGARRYFVNSTTGSDANGCANGQQANTALRTISTAMACVQNNSGDQVLLAEGMSYGGGIGWLAFKQGASAAYPTVIQSYDPVDPGNEAKYGRGDQRSARPVLTSTQGQLSNGTYSFIAIRGLDFNPGNIPEQSVLFVGHGNYLLFENNLFRYTGFSYDSSDAQSATPTAQRVIIRNNSFYGMWSSGGRTGGVYVAGVDGPVIEDNVFWHAGWKIGANRDDSYTVGGATVFSHSFYLQTNTTNGIIRRNLTVDGAGDGGIARGDVNYYENLSIDNPACVGLGGGPNYNVDRPNGVSIQASNNACFGDADVTSTHPLGWGFNTANGIAGSKVHHNLLARSRNVNGPSVGGFSNAAFYDQPSYAAYESNVLYMWAIPTYYAAGGSFPAQAKTTYDLNYWDDVASGTNKNVSSLAMPNAYTAAAVFGAYGFADKNALMKYAIERPEVHIQRKIRSYLFTGYGL